MARKTHTAIVFPAQNHRLETVELLTPEVGPKDVLVRVVYASPTPLDVWQGNFGLIATYPLVPTDNVVGIVEEVGSDVKLVAKGDKVRVVSMDLEAQLVLIGGMRRCFRSPSAQIL